MTTTAMTMIIDDDDDDLFNSPLLEIVWHCILYFIQCIYFKPKIQMIHNSITKILRAPLNYM